MVKHMIKNRLFLILKFVVTLLVISPLYITVIYSVKLKPEIVSNRLTFPKVIHQDNFIRTIETFNFGLAVKNSLFITVAAVLVIILICTMSVYIITRRNSRFYNVVYYIFVSTVIIPFQSTMTPLYINITKQRLLNTLYGFIMAKIGFQIVSAVLLVSEFVKGTLRELEGAAVINSANIYSIFFRIVFPLMKPIILTSMVLNTPNVWNGFQMSLTLPQKRTMCSMPLIQCFLFGENSIKLGLAFALSILSMTPILVPYLTLQKCIIGSITPGVVGS